MSRPIESVKFEPMPMEHIATLTEAGFASAEGNAYVCDPAAGLSIRFGHQSGVYLANVVGDAPPMPWRYMAKADFESLLADAVSAVAHCRAAVQ